MNKRKNLLGGAAIALAMALIGFGVWAAFTDTESTNVALDTGQLDITGGDDIVASNLAPGDVLFRDMTIELPAASNDGNLVQSIDVSTVLNDETVGGSVDTGDPDPDAPFTPGSLWNGTDGIQVVLATCDGGTWTLPSDGDALAGTSTSGINDSATCSGTIIAQAPQPLSTFSFTGGTSLDAADFGETPAGPTGSIPDGAEIELIAQLTLPSSADNGYENAAVDFDFVFEAIQRVGINR